MAVGIKDLYDYKYNIYISLQNLNVSNIYNLNSNKNLDNNKNANFGNANTNQKRNKSFNNLRTLEEKIKRLSEKLKKEKEKKYRYIIKYDELLRNYYLQIVDPQTKKVIKTIPPEFLLKVERNLKKFLLLLEKLEKLKEQKSSQNLNFNDLEKNLDDIKNILEDLDFNKEDINDILSDYTTEFLA